MSPIQRYALSHLEFVESAWKEGQIRAAEAELMAQKEEMEKASIEEDILKRPAQLGTGSAPDSADDDEGVGEGEVRGEDDDEEEEEDSSDEEDDSDDEDEEDDSDEEDEEDSDEEEEEEEESAEEHVIRKQRGSAVHSPRTRSRGDVRINLWKLDAV
jgi:hypothetical protein